jgi:hypothetical protein
MKYVEDTFTDANGTALAAHAPDIDHEGGGWTELAGVWTIQGNQATVTSVAQARAVIDCGLANGRIKADIMIGALAQSASLMFRSNAAGTNFLAVRLNQAAPQIELYSVTAMAPTLITSVTLALDWAEEYELKIEFYNDELRIYVDDLLRISHTTDLYNTQEYVGIYATTNATATFDDLVVDERLRCNYCTTHDLKSRLGAQWTSGTTYDEELEAAIEEASRLIDLAMGWEECHYAASDLATVTRYYDGEGGTELQIDRFLDDADFAVAVDDDGDGVYTAWVRGTDYITWPYNTDFITELVLATGSTVGFTVAQRSVQVTGRLGAYSEPPEVVRKAAVITVAKAWERAMQMFQDTGAVEELGQLKYVLAIDPEVEKILSVLPRRANYG